MRRCADLIPTELCADDDEPLGTRKDEKSRAMAISEIEIGKPADAMNIEQRTYSIPPASRDNWFS